MLRILKSLLIFCSILTASGQELIARQKCASAVKAAVVSPRAKLPHIKDPIAKIESLVDSHKIFEFLGISPTKYRDTLQRLQSLPPPTVKSLKLKRRRILNAIAELFEELKDLSGRSSLAEAGFQSTEEGLKIKANEIHERFISLHYQFLETFDFRAIENLKVNDVRGLTPHLFEEMKGSSSLLVALTERQFYELGDKHTKSRNAFEEAHQNRMLRGRAGIFHPDPYQQFRKFERTPNQMSEVLGSVESTYPVRLPRDRQKVVRKVKEHHAELANILDSWIERGFVTIIKIELSSSYFAVIVQLQAEAGGRKVHAFRYERFFFAH